MLRFTRIERRTLLRAAKRRVAEIKALCLDELPCVVVAELVDEAVALTRCIAMMHPGGRLNASGFERLVRSMLEQRCPWRYRSRALKVIAECAGTLTLVEREADIVPTRRQVASYA